MMYNIEYVLNPVYFRCSWSLRGVYARHQYNGQYGGNHLPVPTSVQRYCVSVRPYSWQGKYKFELHLRLVTNGNKRLKIFFVKSKNNV